MKILIQFIILLLLSTQAAAEDKAIAKLFAEQGMVGTMVIASLHGRQTFIHNAARAKERFTIASTFKIFNTLIALEEKAIAGKDDVLKWDGQLYDDFPAWNHDQTLESAFKVSCVWCYQELARRIGADRYREYLHMAHYGILSEPFALTTFWLDGSLKVSALEQVEFLRQIYLRSLPFSAGSYDTLQQIMIVEQTPKFTLRAKTGWATRVKPEIGWYVGYVETSNDVWFFALNMKVTQQNDLPLRQTVAKAALQAKGVID